MLERRPMHCLTDLGVSLKLLGLDVRDEGHLGWLELSPVCDVVVDSAVALRLEETGEVGSARARNDGERPILVRADTVLQGGRQTRVVERTTLVAPRSSRVVRVRCVERRRWSPPSAATATFATYGSASKAMRERLGDAKRSSFTTTGMPSLEQNAVWAEVAQELDRTSMRARTNTESYLPVLADVRARHLARARASRPKPPPGANAAVVLPFRGAAWIEAFPSQAALRAHAEDLAADLFEEAERADARSPIARHGVLGAAAVVMRSRAVPIPRDGDDDVTDSFALAADGAFGTAVFHEGKLVHLAASVR